MTALRPIIVFIMRTFTCEPCGNEAPACPAAPTAAVPLVPAGSRRTAALGLRVGAQSLANDARASLLGTVLPRDHCRCGLSAGRICAGGTDRRCGTGRTGASPVRALVAPALADT